MRIVFNPQSDQFWHKYYSQQGGLPLQVFVGERYQRGNGLGHIFRGLLRFLMPIAKTAGKAALRTGAAIASDVAEGRPIKDAFQEHTVGKLESMGRKTQKGGGKRTKKRKTQKGKGLGKRGNGKLINSAKPRAKRQRKKKGSDTFGIYYR